MNEERISKRAHALWEDAGKPEGAHQEHWEQACREIEAEDHQTMSDRTKVVATPESRDTLPELAAATT